MADSILRLRVQSDEYDNKLKQATQGLTRYVDQFRKIGGTLEVVEKDTLDYVRALGQMDTTSRTATGKLAEMKKTFTELSVVYKNMTDQEKTSPFGKALSASLDELKPRIIDTKNQLDEINDSLKGMSSKAGGGLFGGGKLDGMLQVFGGNLMTKAAGMAVGFASEIGDAVKQGIELAKAGEGIRIAFERLGRGDILDGLRKATHGTVTDLELMKAAVKFNDFKLPVEELGTMLAFAQQKAKDTGQSVDYMVDSIVTGLGRKSLMILDNLGLSATEIKDKMKETGDMTKAVGAIIREQMAKAGDYVETAADRAAQANVSIQNKMEELGRKFAPLEEASNNLWTSMKIGILDVIGGPLATLLNRLTEAGRLKNMLNDMNGVPGSGNTKVDQQLKKLNVIKKAGGSDYYFQSTLSGMMEDYNRQIMALDAKIKDTKKLSPDQQASKFVRDEVQKMSERMKAIGMMRDQLAAGARELSKPINIETNQGGGSVGGGRRSGGSIKMPTWDDFARQNIKTNQYLDNNLGKVLAERQMPSPWAMAIANPDAFKKELGLNEKTFDLKKDITEKDYKKLLGIKDKDDNKMLDEMQKIFGGVQGIFGGIEQLGIELPEGLKNILSSIQGIMSIVQGITSILLVLETLNEAQTATSFLPFFARGGVVHAANGVVAGTKYSGDNIPAMLNAGETVLTAAQTNTLASNIRNGGLGNLSLTATVTGEQIRFVLNNNGRRTGHGEYVQANFVRS